ncbi:MAG: class I fructose-bisphosphate aldolase, partial [Ruegeria sp.]
MSKADQREQMTNGAGFIAALDQSGGSTPKALALYGVDAGQYGSGKERFSGIQKKRARVILAGGFSKQKGSGAVPFEGTRGEENEGGEG